MSGSILFNSYEETLNMDQSELEKYDLKLQIVRFKSNGLVNGFSHTPQLAPSERLFKQTMYKWKRFIFKNEEKQLLRQGKTWTWFDLFEIVFLIEMGVEVTNIYPDFNIKNIDFIKNTNVSYEFLKEYDILMENLNKGKSIIAICYCNNYKRCHRSLIGNDLKRNGFNSIIIK